MRRRGRKKGQSWKRDIFLPRDGQNILSVALHRISHNILGILTISLSLCVCLCVYVCWGVGLVPFSTQTHTHTHQQRQTDRQVKRIGTARGSE